MSAPFSLFSVLLGVDSDAQWTALTTLIHLSKALTAFEICQVVVVVLTVTRTIKSVVTGQAPLTMELRNIAGKKHKPMVVHAYITADAYKVSCKVSYKISCLRQEHVKVESRVSLLRCARSVLVHTSHYSPGKTNFRSPPKKRLPRTWYYYKIVETRKLPQISHSYARYFDVVSKNVYRTMTVCTLQYGEDI